MQVLSRDTVSTWPADLEVPIPGEEHRAGGGVGTPITIEGYNADADGGVTYTPIGADVRIRHLGGVSQVLGVSVAASDITVQLQTDAGGIPTGTATALKAAYDAVGAAVALATSAVTGTGAGLAGISPNSGAYVEISDGTDGSIRPAYVTQNQREWYLARFAGGWRPPTDFYSISDTTVQWRGLRGLDGIEQYAEYTYTPGALANSTMYYVYAYIASGAIAYEHSTSPPDLYRQFKQGDSTRRYLGCFLSDGTGLIRPFRAVGGRYVFDDRVLAFSGLQATAFTDRDISAYVPAYCQRALLWCFLKNYEAGGNSLLVCRGGASLASGPSVMLVDGKGADTYRSVGGPMEVILSAGGTIAYKLGTRVDALTIADIYVIGFQE